MTARDEDDRKPTLLRPSAPLNMESERMKTCAATAERTVVEPVNDRGGSARGVGLVYPIPGWRT